jgi:hypothetical protein
VRRRDCPARDSAYGIPLISDADPRPPAPALTARAETLVAPALPSSSGGGIMGLGANGGMGGIFISSRREDTGVYAGHLVDLLESGVGKGNIFLDIVGIGLGARFPSVIHDRLNSCDTLVALIRKHWLTTKDRGGRRLDEPHAFRASGETRAALARDEMLVIPVLVEGTRLPEREELPKIWRHFRVKRGAAFDRGLERRCRRPRPGVGGSRQRCAASEPDEAERWLTELASLPCPDSSR